MGDWTKTFGTGLGIGVGLMMTKKVVEELKDLRGKESSRDDEPLFRLW